jgi:hypothetical protein
MERGATVRAHGRWIEAQLEHESHRARVIQPRLVGQRSALGGTELRHDVRMLGDQSTRGDGVAAMSGEQQPLGQ